MPHSFTPGPWETLKFSQHELQIDFAMVKIGERVHMIGYSDEDKANAQLIAAAPELLEALKYCRNKIAYMQAHGEWYSPGRAIEMADAAIAKAGGES